MSGRKLLSPMVKKESLSGKSKIRLKALMSALRWSSAMIGMRRATVTSSDRQRFATSRMNLRRTFWSRLWSVMSMGDQTVKKYVKRGSMMAMKSCA